MQGPDGTESETVQYRRSGVGTSLEARVVVVVLQLLKRLALFHVYVRNLQSDLSLVVASDAIGVVARGFHKTREPRKATLAEAC